MLTTLENKADDAICTLHLLVSYALECVIEMVNKFFIIENIKMQRLELVVCKVVWNILGDM